MTYYGTDNQIDGVVLDVLLRKHRTIRSSLGISVPVPVDTEKVVEAIFEGLLLKSKPSTMDNYLPGFEEYMKPTREDLYGKWDAVADRESVRGLCLRKKRLRWMKCLMSYEPRRR